MSKKSLKNFPHSNIEEDDIFIYFAAAGCIKHSGRKQATTPLDIRHVTPKRRLAQKKNWPHLCSPAPERNWTETKTKTCNLSLCLPLRWEAFLVRSCKEGFFVCGQEWFKAARFCWLYFFILCWSPFWGDMFDVRIKESLPGQKAATIKNSIL